MKKVLPVLFLLVFLSSCGSDNKAIDQATSLRTSMLQASGCEFSAEVTADYGDVLHVFKMHCVSDSNGNIQFEVVAPDSIAGITGKLHDKGSHLLFDEHALLFSMLADGEFSPVSGPWIFLRSLRAGYISGCSEQDGKLEIHIDDTYDEGALKLIVLTDEDLKPTLAEIYDQGCCIMTIQIENFFIL